jgi:hypothetical protein
MPCHSAAYTKWIAPQCSSKSKSTGAALHRHALCARAAECSRFLPCRSHTPLSAPGRNLGRMTCPDLVRAGVQASAWRCIDDDFGPLPFTRLLIALNYHRRRNINISPACALVVPHGCTRTALPRGVVSRCCSAPLCYRSQRSWSKGLLAVRRAVECTTPRRQLTNHGTSLPACLRTLPSGEPCCTPALLQDSADPR